MKPKPVLFLDFDDVILPTREASVRFFKQHYGSQIPDDVYLCGHNLMELVFAHLPEDSVPTREEFYLHFGKNFLASLEWHEGIEPMKGSIEVIPQLSKQYDLWVATARLSYGRPVVKHLLSTFFPGHIKGVHHVWEHTEGLEFAGTPKKDFASRFEHRRAFFDDNPIEIREMIGTVDSFLFDPLGYHLELEDIPNRIQSWEEIGNLFL